MFNSNLKLQLSTNACPAQLVTVSCHLKHAQHRQKAKNFLFIILHHLCMYPILSYNIFLTLQNAANEGSCSGGYHYTSLFPDLFHFHELTPPVLPCNTSLYNTIQASQLFQNSVVLFLWLKALSENANIPCCQLFLIVFKSLLIFLVTDINFRSSHTDFTAVGTIPMGYIPLLKRI